MGSEKLKKDNIIAKKSFEYAIRVVTIYKGLTEGKREYVLSKQFDSYRKKWTPQRGNLIL